MNIAAAGQSGHHAWERDIGLRTFVERLRVDGNARPSARYLLAPERAVRWRCHHSEGPHQRRRLLPSAQH